MDGFMILFFGYFSVEQLLCQRQMDPESMLRNLGFDGGPNSDESANRIPERFLVNPCAAKGIDIFQFVMTHPELQHMVYERTPPVAQPGTPTAPPMDETDSVTDNAPQQKGQCSNANVYIATDYNYNLKAGVMGNIYSDSFDRTCSRDDVFESSLELPEGLGEADADTKSLDRAKLLELSGIIPERYLIKAKKRSSVDSEDIDENVFINDFAEEQDTEEQNIAPDKLHNELLDDNSNLDNDVDDRVHEQHDVVGISGEKGKFCYTGNTSTADCHDIAVDINTAETLVGPKSQSVKPESQIVRPKSQPIKLESQALMQSESAAVECLNNNPGQLNVDDNKDDSTLDDNASSPVEYKVYETLV